MTEPVVEFRGVDVVFGPSPHEALTRLKEGEGLTTIQEKTGNVIAVQGASFMVEHGEVCVLMGLSGSGKSTLLRCVNGLCRPTRGEVLVGHLGSMVDVASCSETMLRNLRGQRIAMVFQQFALLPWRTVAENVGFGLELQNMPPSQRDKAVRKQLELVHLEGWADKQVHELSGGMQQRVGLARAFATDADILLMDEPFSALDPLIRTHLQDELLQLQSSLGKSILFVSHDLEEAVKLGTHIAILHEGRLVQHDTPEEIILNPANDYVAEFVTHLNPLGVLKGSAVMSPLNSVQGNLRKDATRMPAETPLKTLLETRVKTRRPIVLVSDGKEIGMVLDEDFFRGILHKRRIIDPNIEGKA